MQNNYEKVTQSIFDKLFSFIRNIKIQQRLIISFLLISLIPLSITGISSYNQSSTAIDSKTKNYSVQIMNQISKNIEIEMAKVEDYSKNIMNSPDIQNNFSLLGGDGSEESTKATQIITAYMQSTLSSIFI